MLRAKEKAAGEALLSDLRKGKEKDRVHHIQLFFQYGAHLSLLPHIFMTLYFSLLVIFNLSFQQNRSSILRDGSVWKQSWYCSWKRKSCTAPSGFWPVWWEARFQLIPAVAGYKECQKAGKGVDFHLFRWESHSVREGLSSHYPSKAPWIVSISFTIQKNSQIQ